MVGTNRVGEEMKYLLKMKYLVLKIIFLGCDLLLSESYFWFLLDDESG
jgi:hypothetical protein